jgi:hypothetical protein
MGICFITSCASIFSINLFMFEINTLIILMLLFLVPLQSMLICKHHFTFLAYECFFNFFNYRFWFRIIILKKWKTLNLTIRFEFYNFKWENCTFYQALTIIYLCRLVNRYNFLSFSKVKFWLSKWRISNFTI